MKDRRRKHSVLLLQIIFMERGSAGRDFVQSKIPTVFTRIGVQMNIDDPIQIVSLLVGVVALLATLVSGWRISRGVDIVNTKVNSARQMLRLKLSDESRLETKINEIMEVTKTP